MVYKPWASSEIARRTKVATRSRDTRPELRVRSELHRRGYRFRVCYQPVPGLRRTADIVFTRQKVAVFVDGCFWHGCPDHFRQPGTNHQYWSTKIQRNVDRDAETNQKLAEAGWTVLRFWEHTATEQAVAQIAELLKP